MKFILSLLLILQVCSCTLISKMVADKPKVELESIEFISISWSKVELAIKLDVENPNSFTIGLANLDYIVLIGDKQIGKGQYKGDFSVEGNKSKILAIPLVLNSQATLKIAQAYLQGKANLKAHIIGTSDFTTPLGTFQIPIDETKDIVKSGT